MMHLYPEGLLPAVYPSVPTKLIVCALDTPFVKEVAEELEPSSAHEIRPQVAFFDESLSSLVRLLEAEARSDRSSQRLYVEHLTYALTLRLLSLGMKIEPA